MGELKAPIGPNTAHLWIDMQRLFSDEGPWRMAWMPRVTPKVEQLVARAPEQSIFTRFIPPEKPEDAPERWRAYYEKWSDVTRRQIDSGRLQATVQSFTMGRDRADRTRVISIFPQPRPQRAR